MTKTVQSRRPPGRVISILQPGYLPYAGFFELMARCDVFVIYDDVQYDKNSWRNRNRIRGPEGPVWLTVPVKVKGRFGQAIDRVEIDNSSKWAKKHLGTIRQCYSRAPHFDEHFEFMSSVLGRKWNRLIDLDVAIIDYFRELLGVSCDVVFSSGLAAAGNKTERIVAVCRELAADAYISTNGASSYLQEEVFAEAGLQLAYQDYSPAEYPQAHEGFVSHLSVLDMAMNLGPDSMRTILSTSSCPFNPSGGFRGHGRA